MTLIFSVTTSSHSFMASDTLAYDACSMNETDAKIFQKGALLIGGAGSFNLINVIKYDCNIPLQGKESDEDYMFKRVYKSIKNAFVKNELITLNDAEYVIPGSVLINHKNQIYNLMPNCCLIRINKAFAAIGSASEAALGSYATINALLQNKLSRHAIENFTTPQLIQLVYDSVVTFNSTINNKVVIKHISLKST